MYSVRYLSCDAIIDNIFAQSMSKIHLFQFSEISSIAQASIVAQFHMVSARAMAEAQRCHIIIVIVIVRVMQT